MSDPGLTPWLAFCAKVVPLHASPEEVRRMVRVEEPETEEDFEALLNSLPPLAGGAGGGGPQHTHMETKSTTTRNKVTLQKAHSLRHSVTDAEKKLWTVLHGKKLGGHKFRRQQAVGKYTADFLSHSARLIIELDGGQHATQQAYDAQRSTFLQQAGYKVLRFLNDDVFQNFEGVVQVISSALAERTLIISSPAGGGGKALPKIGHLSGVDAATTRRLKRGQLHPDSVLDLHGYGLTEAFATFTARIRAARAQGVRLLLVITGKGRARGPGGVDGDGKLRHALPHWLADAAVHPHIVAATAAHRSHGGAGAFYLLLRKPT